MIHIVDLMWIVPLCLVIGAVASAFFCGATLHNREYDAYQEGIRYGKSMHREKIELPYCNTLEELFDRGFNSDFNKFKETIGGIMYGVNDSGQMYMIFVDTVDDLCNYYDCTLLSVNDEVIYQRPCIKGST